MFDYQKYLQKKDALSFEEGVDIYNAILNLLESKDDYLHELWKDVINSALTYTNMRVNWLYFSTEEKIEKDTLRTNYHNTFIINLKAFQKCAEQLGLDTKDMKQLGSSEDRKRWGDFAGYIICIENIRAR